MHSNTNRECIRVIFCNRSIRIFPNIQIGGICRFLPFESGGAHFCAFVHVYVYVYHRISCTMVSLFPFGPNRSINILVRQFLGRKLDGGRRHTIFSDCIADYCTSLWHLTWLYAVILLRNGVYLRAWLCSDDFILFCFTCFLLFSYAKMQNIKQQILYFAR